MSINCLLCNTNSEFLFSGQLLQKYTVSYYQCTHCQFIQTETPYWLDEAYSSAITSLDIGMVARNQSLSKTISSLLYKHFNYHNEFLDYAGGYGLFVRMMRDEGFNFFWYDQYCDNLFANQFTLNENKSKVFEAVTAFEVFEHLPAPLDTIKKMFSYSNTLIFSTELQPQKITSVEQWDYFASETGQHISFYSIDSLKVLAQCFNCNLYSDNSSLHILTKREFPQNILKHKKSFLYKLAERYINKYRTGKTKKELLPSLISNDFNIIRKNLHE